MRLYVASSWRNERYPHVVEALRAAGHEVYDFRDANRSFNWAEIDAAWDPANPILDREDLKRALDSPQAEQAFAHDMDALNWAEGGVLVMPCGRSAHLEAGYLRGRGLPVHILLSDQEKPDLMHKMAEVHEGIETILPRLVEQDRHYNNARDRVATYEGLIRQWDGTAKRHRDAGRAVMADAAESAVATIQEALGGARKDLQTHEARLHIRRA